MATMNRNTPVDALSTQILGTQPEIRANLALTETGRQGLIGFSDT